jgi:hypothetical protein
MSSIPPWLAALCTCAALAAACGDDVETKIEQARAPDAGPVETKISNAGIACSLLNRSCEGSAAQCLEVSYSGAFYPGGYCTADCKQSAECGLDAVCPVGEAERVAADYAFRSTWARKCFKTCVPNATKDPCRPGYACRSLAESYAVADAPTPMHTPVCLPSWSSSVARDAGAPDDDEKPGRADASTSGALKLLDAGR